VNIFESTGSAPGGARHATMTGLKNEMSLPRPARVIPSVRALSARALSTPEPFVRLFTRRVQQEGALDLTQGDYKNADFKPHPEVVRAAQRITRNTVHSYGPAVGRMDVRSEVAEFFNRDGLFDYPDSEVRFLPDEVLFTPGTRSGLAFVLEVLGADGSGVVVPRPSWEYDWFVERAGKKVVELPTSAPDFLPDPEELAWLLGQGGISSVILNNPHNPTGRVYPRALVEELVGVAAKHRCYVLYDSVYQRLDYVGWFVNPAFARPEWRDWVVSLSGLSKMDMFGASTGTRACWLVISDQIRSDGVRAREILANLSAWLVATPSTLAQDWALAALQSPLAALRRPSPYMRERRDFMARAADELAPLGVERTDFGGTFYSPLAFPGLVGEPFDRLRNGIHEKAVVKDSVDAFEFLLSGGVGGIPFAAFAGGGESAGRYGTWQRLSYGSKDVKERAVFVDRVRTRIAKQGRLGASAPAAAASRPPAPQDAVWESVCTADGYDALEGLDPKEFAAVRRRFLDAPRGETLRLTGTKHPDSTAHRAEQLGRALRTAPDGAPDRARLALTHLEWNPLMEARSEYEESLADLRGPCSEVLLDMEGRQVSPEWLDLPEKVVLALLRYGIVPGEDRHLLFRVPNPFIEQDEEKVAKILACVARANVLFLLACERLGIVPSQNAIYEITVPQVNSTTEIGAVVKIGTLYLQAVEGLFGGSPERRDAFLVERVPEARRGELLARVARVRLVPLCENVGALARLPDLLEAFYLALERGLEVEGLPTPAIFRTAFDRPEATVRVFVAMSDTAEQSGKLATDAACALAVSGREEAERRLATHARRVGEPPPSVTFLIGAGRAGFRGGLDPTHPGVLRQFARADGVTLQGIRADAPEEAARLASAFRAEVAARARDRGLPLPAADAESLSRLLEGGVKAHTETLLRIAPLLAPFGSLVPQTRVRIRATGSVNYGRSIPTYPEEWGGGKALPDNRDLRDAWPEGVTLPRAIIYNLACTTLGLPAVTSDLAVLDRRAAVLLDRHAPGYREIVASELPCFVKESAALVFGRKLAETTARRCQRAAAALWVDARTREELVAPTCLFAMEYLRYLAEDSESWDETKEHESQTTREEELIRETSSVAFAALCTERPGDRWPVLQTLVDAEDASRLLLARELTLEEKREFVDLRIEGWLRTLSDALAPELRREWSRLRELGQDELTLDAIQRLVALEGLRGSRGA
jgi:aspartate/methionine/tyrosine aminotransferase/phosphoenolpyruvate carboxylase